MPYFAERELKEKLLDLDLTADMVKKKLKTIKTNKSPGPDAIHPRVLHEIAPSIAVPLTVIFQTSIIFEKV